MLKIRLRRMGATGTARYRVVVSDSRSTPQGAFVDVLGIYDPNLSPPRFELDVPRTERWIAQGAHPSDTVKSLLARTRAVRP